MKKSIVVIALGSLALAGCPPKETAPAISKPADGGIAPIKRTETPTTANVVTYSDEPVATIGGRTITMRQVTAPIIESRGLNTLLILANLEVAKLEAQKRGIVVTQADFDQELEQWIDQQVLRNSDVFDRIKNRIDRAEEQKNTSLAAQLREELKQDRSRLLIQLLEKENVGRPEFDIVRQTDTYLRKIAEPALKDKITDDELQEKFKIAYGEKVRVRHIVLANMQEVAEARRRLAANVPFEQIAREMSRNKGTAAIGGELSPISRSTPNLAQVFKDAAFALKPGQVSDVVQVDGGYHLIKLEERIMPRIIKFDDVKESLRAELTEDWLKRTVTLLRQDLSQRVVNTLKIENPSLKAQFEARLNENDKLIKEREQIKREMDKQRERLQQEQLLPTTEPAASQPATVPSTIPASQPEAAPATGVTSTMHTAEVVQPPATKPAAELPGTSPSSTSHEK